MCRNFSITELETSVQQKSSTDEKILFISEKIIEGNRYLVNMSQTINSIKNAELVITTETPVVDCLLNDLLLKDGVLRNKIALESICTIKEILNESVEFYINHAKLLKKHLLDKLKIQVKTEPIKESKIAAETISPERNKILWKRSDAILYKILRILTENKYMQQYTKEDVLNHFLLPKQIITNAGSTLINSFIWMDNDTSFSVLVYELAKSGCIDDKDKFKIMSEHFLNNRGEKFKYLSQKRSYTDSLNDSGIKIRELLSFLKNI